MDEDIEFSVGDLPTMGGGDLNRVHGEEKNVNYALKVGAHIGDYAILHFIAKGGMGEVYHVRQVKLGTEFAMKVLLPEATRNPMLKARFEIEARVMAALTHPNIVKVHYFGEHDNMPFMVMDLITTHRGKPYSLEEVVDERGKLPEEEVKILLDQINSALNYMHSYKGHGVIHRDLKPANIMLNKEGQILITDFGLVKVNDPELKGKIADLEYEVDGGISIGDLKTMAGGTSSHDLTMQGAVLGTYDYMAPEIMDGKEASVQSDIYAVGIILYKMLTGTMPRGRFELPSFFGATESWDQLVDACLANQPEKRPQTIDTLQRLHKKLSVDTTDIVQSHVTPQQNIKQSPAGKPKAKEARPQQNIKRSAAEKSKVLIFSLVGLTVLLLGAYWSLDENKLNADLPEVGLKIISESASTTQDNIQGLSAVSQSVYNEFVGE